VRLVSEAESSQAPFVRLADRYAAWFLLVSLAAAGGAWALAGAARAVAVLVVATPCPLILAAPVAVVSGMSVAARRGVVVKGGFLAGPLHGPADVGSRACAGLRRRGMKLRSAWKAADRTQVRVRKHLSRS